MQETSQRLRRHHLSSWHEAGDGQGLPDEDVANKVISPLAQRFPNMNFKNPKESVVGHIIQNDSKAGARPQELAAGCVRASSCRKLWWDPSEVKAAVLTCGGICPGLNSIIRSLVNCLWCEYDVREIFGMQNGFNGLSSPEELKPIMLTPGFVREIHMKGGSVLKSGRGGFDVEKILNTMQRLGINMIFLIGGQGTQFAGNLLYEAALKRQQAVSVIGIPKSIDNDTPMFDRTFGFQSAVAEASEVIRNAWVEASSCDRGVGIVKLMGRDAGFLAMTAALASDLVDLCLIPEVTFKMEHVFEHLDRTLERDGHMVIAVAEGAGRDHVATGQTEPNGRAIYGDIGTFLRDEVNKHLEHKGGRSFYLDPSYIIRSAPVRPHDHSFCSRLSVDACHTAMRGYTGVCVGPLHDVMVILPSRLIARGARRVNVKRSAWQQCVQACGMPRTLSGQGEGPDDA